MAGILKVYHLAIILNSEKVDGAPRNFAPRNFAPPPRDKIENVSDSYKVRLQFFLVQFVQLNIKFCTQTQDKITLMKIWSIPL